MFPQECPVLTFYQLRTIFESKTSVQCKLEEKLHFSCGSLFGSDYVRSLPQGIAILIFK